MSTQYRLIALMLVLHVPMAHLTSRVAWDQHTVQEAPDRPDRRHEGSVTGKVFDGKGSVVPGATVSLQDTVTEEAPLTVTSDARGHYAFTSLLPGGYGLWATKGDQESTHQSIKVTNGPGSVYDLTLKKGGL
jgi:protocatechuate 3,4-dioxygenase beta subunit